MKTEYPNTDVNDSIIKGRLVKDPEVTVTSNGKCVVNLTVASNTFYGRNGRADFVPVRILGTDAENVADNLDKGSAITVKGILASDNGAIYLLAKQVMFYSHKQKKTA